MRCFVAGLLLLFASFSARSQEGALNPIAEEARQKGLRGCVPILNKITNPLIDKARYGGISVAASSETKDRLYSVVFSRQVPGAPNQLVSIAVSPDNRCSTTIEITTVWSASCEQVAARVYPTYTRAAPMTSSAVMVTEAPHKSAYLLPLAGACLSIQKDTVFYPASKGWRGG
jgi:hypothetical protein